MHRTRRLEIPLAHVRFSIIPGTVVSNDEDRVFTSRLHRLRLHTSERQLTAQG